MPKSICAFDECSKPAKCRGWCSAHYERWRKHGDPSVVMPPVDPPVKRTQFGPCTVDGCNLDPWARGYCSNHYQKWRQYGDPTADNRRKRTYCTVDGCEAQCQGNGLCRRHYLRVRAHGTVELPKRRTDTCTVSECDKTPGRWAKYCDSHYTELNRYGSIGSPNACVDCSVSVVRQRLRCEQCAYAIRLRRAKDQGHQRRASMRATRIERIDSLDIYVRDEWMCMLCVQPVDRLLKWPAPMSASLDHIKPIVKGGDHVPTNVQLAHLRCNTSKGARTVDAVSI